MRTIVVILSGLLLSVSSVQADVRDPTKPPSYLPKAEQKQVQEKLSLHLSSIMISGARRHAVVNKKQVGVGDAVADMHVTQINEQGVELRNAESRIWLTLARGTMRKTASGGI